MCLSDKSAFEELNCQHIGLHGQEPSEWDVLLNAYIAVNGKPDPLWPMLQVLDYRAVNVKPCFHIESLEVHAKSIDPEMLAKARDGFVTLVYCIIPNGQCTAMMVELYIKQWIED